MDSWGRKIICLLLLSMEEVDDIYIIGFVVTRFVLFGAGAFLMYHKLQELLPAIGKVPDMHKGMCMSGIKHLTMFSCNELEVTG